MELDTIQKIVGITGGVIAILGALFGIWRDWTKIHDRLPKRIDNKTDYLFPIGCILFIGGVAVLFIGGVLSSIINNASFAHFMTKALLILCSGGGFFTGMGFISFIFDDNVVSSKVSNLLWGLLFFGIGFGMIYLLVPQNP